MNVIPFEKEIQKIKNREYGAAIKETLSLAAEVLKHVFFELCEDNFPELWAEQYRTEGRVFPCVERTTLFLVNETYEIETAVNHYLRSIGETEFHLRKGTVVKNTDRIKIRQVPDRVFLPAVTAWLRKLPAHELEQTAHELLRSMDIGACAESFLFTVDEVTGDKILLSRLVKMYGTTTKQHRYFETQLKAFKNYRNLYKGHDNEITLDNTNEVQLFQIIESISDFVDTFTQSRSSSVSDALSRFQRYIQDDARRLTLPPIVVADFEEKHQLPQGKLAPALASFRELRRKMDPDHTVILFTPQDEIKQYYSAHTYDFDVAREMKAEPHNAVFDEPKPLSFKLLSEYHNGQLSVNQVNELVSQFVILLDLDTLLSAPAMKVVAAVLGPAVKKHHRCLLVDWGTLSYLYRTEKDSEHEAIRMRAHTARLQLYHMQKMGLIRYVGDMDHRIDPSKSLLDFVRNHRKIPICVVTANRLLAAQLNTIETPNCLTLTNWRDEGIMIRTISKKRLAVLCTDGLSSETEPLQSISVASPDVLSTIPQPVLMPKSAGTKMPSAGSTVWDETGTPVQLTTVVGQPGGEGTVYQTNRPGMVAKIYHANQVNPARQKKLTAMRAIPVEHECICWPTSLLFTEHNAFVGFLMAEAPHDAIEMGLSIFKLGGEHVQKHVLPGWNRLSLAKVCVGVSSTFAFLHRRNILMGDVNPRNLLVSPSNPDKVFFVDCDSYQVGEYVCPVGMAEYSSPEILERLKTTQGGYANCPRTIEDEQFALASLLFHIIMLGQTPFAAKNNEKIEEAIQTYSFAYRTKTNRGTDVPDGPYALIWNNTPPYIKEKFASVFTGQEKFSADSWNFEFRRYVDGITAGRSSADLLPKKYFDATGTFFRDFVCVGCKEESNMSVEKHDRLVKYRQPLLCNRCMSILWPLQEQPATVICDTCHRAYSGTMYDKAMQEYGKRCKCPTCKERGNTTSRFFEQR